MINGNCVDQTARRRRRTDGVLARLPAPEPRAGGVRGVLFAAHAGVLVQACGIVSADVGRGDLFLLLRQRENRWVAGGLRR